MTIGSSVTLKYCECSQKLNGLTEDRRQYT